MLGGWIVYNITGTGCSGDMMIKIDWCLLPAFGALCVVDIEGVPVQGSSKASVGKLGAGRIAGKQVGVVGANGVGACREDGNNSKEG